MWIKKYAIMYCNMINIFQVHDTGEGRQQALAGSTSGKASRIVSTGSVNKFNSE